MKITVIYGTMHKGSTYNCVKLLLDRIQNNDTNITEFFLPNAMPHFCCSCFSCFLNGEETCPHYKEMNPIAHSIEKSDLIILASPVYVCNVTGQIKAFLDHLGYRWMPHRPHPEMFHKTGLVISTAAGTGTKATNKTMKKSLVYWGVNKIYSYGINVAAMSWNDVDIKKKKQIEKQLTRLASKIIKTTATSNKKSPNYFTKMLFTVMKISQKSNTWNRTDYNHWKNNGWLDGKKPW